MTASVQPWDDTGHHFRLCWVPHAGNDLQRGNKLQQKQTLVSLSTPKADFSCEPGLRNDNSKCHLWWNQFHILYHRFFLSFEAKCKALGNHCNSTVSLTNVQKIHWCQKKGQQYKTEPLTFCHWSYWTHFLLFQHEQIQAWNILRRRIL